MIAFCFIRSLVLLLLITCCVANTEIINFYYEPTDAPADVERNTISPSSQITSSIPISLSPLTGWDKPKVLYKESNLSWTLVGMDRGSYTARFCWSAGHAISAKLRFDPPSTLHLTASFASVYARPPPSDEIDVPFNLLVEPLIFGLLPETTVPLVVSLTVILVVGTANMGRLKRGLIWLTTIQD
ncbi:hypothetical protein BT69DRAFT_1315844 [Atractiella rhizophila]|nr:hypothetical protein BT69DRAFT_1315844 [Atractiella rhizophila]